MNDSNTEWYDIEVYKNYFLAYFLNVDGTETTFEIFDKIRDFEIEEFLQFVRSKCIVGFNNKSYDDVLIKLMANNGSGYDKVNFKMKDSPLTEIVKNESNKIIENSIKPWNFCKLHNINTRDLNTIDIKEVLVGQASLKLYGARAGSKKLQELPIHHDTTLTLEQKEEIKKYCRNDLEVTRMLSEAIVEQIKLREEMGKEFGIDLRSKSDAQIAEVVINKYYKDKTGDDVSFPDSDDIQDSYKYNPPSWIKFNSNELNTLLHNICNDEFKINEKLGSVELPDCLKGRVIFYGNKSYAMGIGGLHSIDGVGYYKSDSEHSIFDIDVASFYPKMILNGRFYPKNIGEEFLDIYETIVNRRLDAKARVAELHAMGELSDELKQELVSTTNTMNALKITINGSFGKFGSKYSKLYSPDLLFHTTVSGQLTLLMLIERMEDAGIPAISANTDGVVFYINRDDESLMRDIVAKWEDETQLQMEYNEYKSIFYRDVNNYVAFTTNDKAKTKGVFTKADLAHNPTADIMKRAAIQYLGFDIPVHDTIKECTDITQFLQVRTVKGGAVKDEKQIGKAIRWYYSTMSETAINYADTGNMVPNSIGGIPCMDLPDTIPSDLDYQWYINEAHNLIDMVNIPCIIGQNKKADGLRKLGYSPCFISHKGKTLPKEGFDFSRDEEIGTQTGQRAGIMVVDGTLYKCDNLAYPSGYKAFEKATGVNIVYGGVVSIPEVLSELTPLPRWVDTMIWDYCSKQQRVKLDQYRKGLLF